MSGWEQVAGSGENDPLKLAESGEKQQWSFHGHVFDFECRPAPHKYPLIPNGVQLEMQHRRDGRWRPGGADRVHRGRDPGGRGSGAR